jgi:hypothetical protein
MTAPHQNAQLAEVQRKAMAAARAPAQAAQERADMIALPRHAHNQIGPTGNEAADVNQWMDPSEQLAAEDLQVPEGIEGDLDELLDGPSSDPATM